MSEFQCPDFIREFDRLLRSRISKTFDAANQRIRSEVSRCEQTRQPQNPYIGRIAGANMPCPRSHFSINDGEHEEGGNKRVHPFDDGDRFYRWWRSTSEQTSPCGLSWSFTYDAMIFGSAKRGRSGRLPRTISDVPNIDDQAVQLILQKRSHGEVRSRWERVKHMIPYSAVAGGWQDALIMTSFNKRISLAERRRPERIDLMKMGRS